MQPQPDTVPVRVSTAHARQRFHGCTPEYIAQVCHAACCKTSAGPTRIPVLPREVLALRAAGHTVQVVDDLLQPQQGCRTCQFEDGTTHLCALHPVGMKPVPCTASPFGLTTRDTLVVKNRYRLLRCYNVEPRLPAYVAFRSSLDMLFGDAEAGRICLALDRGAEGMLAAHMLRSMYDDLHTIAAIRARATERARASGISGPPRGQKEAAA